MQLTTLMVIASLFVATSLTAVVGRSSTHCPGAHAVSHEMIGPVNFTTFACPESSPTDLKVAASSISKRGPIFHPIVSANIPRQFQNCVGGPADPECECAVSCGPLPFCESHRAVSPVQSDCQAISNTLDDVSGSFFVEAGMGVSLTFQSCEIVWVNGAGRELEYCFQNLARLTSAQYTNCVIVSGGGQGGCIADDFLWFFEFLIPGNSIIVP